MQPRATNMTLKIVRYGDVETKLGMNRITIWRRTKTDPTFPRPFKLGSGRTAAVGFIAAEIEAWIARQAGTRPASDS